MLTLEKPGIGPLVRGGNPDWENCIQLHDNYCKKTENKIFLQYPKISYVT